MRALAITGGAIGLLVFGGVAIFFPQGAATPLAIGSAVLLLYASRMRPPASGPSTPGGNDSPVADQGSGSPVPSGGAAKVLAVAALVMILLALFVLMMFGGLFGPVRIV